MKTSDSSDLLDSDVTWIHLTLYSNDSCRVWHKSTYSYYKKQ